MDAETFKKFKEHLNSHAVIERPIVLLIANLYGVMWKWNPFS